MIPTEAAHPPQPSLAAFAVGKLTGPDADAITAHLAGCAACREFVARTPNDTLIGLLKPTAGHSAATRTDAAAHAAPSPAEVPPELRQHPKYHVLKPLGQGGMGSVFLA